MCLHFEAFLSFFHVLMISEGQEHKFACVKNFINSFIYYSNPLKESKRQASHLPGFGQ